MCACKTPLPRRDQRGIVVLEAPPEDPLAPAAARGMSFLLTRSNVDTRRTRAMKGVRSDSVIRPLNRLSSSLIVVPRGGMLAMISASEMDGAVSIGAENIGPVIVSFM